MAHALHRLSRAEDEGALLGAARATPPLCPMHPRHWLPRRAVGGYCDTTWAARVETSRAGLVRER